MWLDCAARDGSLRRVPRIYIVEGGLQGRVWPLNKFVLLDSLIPGIQKQNKSQVSAPKTVEFPLCQNLNHQGPKAKSSQNKNMCSRQLDNPGDIVEVIDQSRNVHMLVLRLWRNDVGLVFFFGKLYSSENGT